MSLNPSLAACLHLCVIQNPPAGHVGKVMCAPASDSGIWESLGIPRPIRRCLIESSAADDLFIRPCYDRVFRQVLHFALRNPRAAKRGVLIAGNPGIGKSYFLVFLLWRLFMSVSGNATQLRMLDHQKPPDNLEISASNGINNVIYVSGYTVLHWQIQRGTGSTQIILLPVDGTDLDKWNTLARQRALFNDSSTWLLWDCVQSSVEAPSKQSTGRAIVVVASSPDEKKYYHEFRHNLQASITMALWSLDEIDAATVSVYRGIYELEDVQRRLFRFGGTARLVFRSRNSEIQIEQDEKTAVHHSDLGNWMEGIDTGETNYISHHIIGRDVDPKMIRFVDAKAIEDPSMLDNIRTSFLNSTVEVDAMEQMGRTDPHRVARWLVNDSIRIVQ